ncbi:MAG: hypothetical protein R6V58_02295 [Planctomycetota bacterium]
MKKPNEKTAVEFSLPVTREQAEAIYAQGPEAVVFVLLEVAATILAHNLTHVVIHQAAQKADIPPDRIGFIRAVRSIVLSSAALRAASPSDRPAVYDRMLDHIARRPNPYRPGRVEPRLCARFGGGAAGCSARMPTGGWTGPM